MHWWRWRYYLQNIIIWNQILMGILLLVLFALNLTGSDKPLYAVIVLGEMMFMFAIWWKVIVGKI